MGPKKLADRGVGVQIHLVTLCGKGKVFFSQGGARLCQPSCGLLKGLPCRLDQGNLSEAGSVGHHCFAPSVRGFGFSGELYEGSSFLLRFCPQWTGCFGDSYRTAWAVAPRCLCSYAYGRRVAVGPQTGARSWELLQDLWKAIAPQMAPWCAGGVMPTCANLTFYGGSGSCVRWHSDDEVLFGAQGESKLIVSVSIGFSALFRWKPWPSPDCEADSTWLHHGDLLVMDGRCQDEYLHSTDPKLDGERVNVTFRCLKNHLPQCPLGAGVVCCLPTCAKGLPVPVCAGRMLCFVPGANTVFPAGPEKIHIVALQHMKVAHQSSCWIGCFSQVIKNREFNCQCWLFMTFLLVL